MFKQLIELEVKEKEALEKADRAKRIARHKAEEKLNKRLFKEVNKALKSYVYSTTRSYETASYTPVVIYTKYRFSVENLNITPNALAQTYELSEYSHCTRTVKEELNYEQALEYLAKYAAKRISDKIWIKQLKQGK